MPKKFSIVDDKKVNKEDEKRRTRNWTFLIWLDSAPDNWREILDAEHIQWVESPVHDKDLNDDGSTKKPHIHIGVVYDSVKSYSQVKELTDKLHTTIPERMASLRGLVRYMAHLDNPEKAQYNISDIIGHNGIDVADILKMSASEIKQIVKDIIDFIIKNDIREYSDLVEYAYLNDDKWIDVIMSSHTLFLTHFLNSRRYRAKEYSIQKALKEEQERLQESKMLPSVRKAAVERQLQSDEQEEKDVL